MKRRICVIGAGPTGITAVKNLQDEGLDVVCYDRNKDVGGNWIYTENDSHSSVFDTTHIISSKTLSQYEDFPFDQFEPNVPDYPGHNTLRRYFQAYAKHFKLYQNIVFETLVQHCERVDDQTWKVTVEQHGENRTEIFTDLVVCNGHHWNPRHPQYPGEFTGEYLHSHIYKKAAPFAGKRVLVIGGGNSACDVAVETSRVTEKTAISMRRGYYILPKFIMGVPTDVFGSRMAFLPVRLRYFLSGIVARMVIGKNQWYGLPKFSEPFGATHPTVNSELLYKLRHGAIEPHGDIDHFEDKKVVFKDGTAEEFDTIIACTGYILSHPFFDSDFIDFSEGDIPPLWLKMFHEKYRNLYFIGMFQPLGCIWPGAEIQARIAARELAGKWERPKNIADLCHREATHPYIRQVKTPRHSITVDYQKFVRELKKALKRYSISKKMSTI